MFRDRRRQHPAGRPVAWVIGSSAVALVLVGSAAIVGGVGRESETATGVGVNGGGTTQTAPDDTAPGQRVGSHPRPTTHSVVIVGDSITYQSTDELHALADQRGISLTIEATPRATARLMLEQARFVDPGRVDQMIINVGTNDIIQAVPLDRTLADIVELIRLYPEARCVHLVTINAHMVSLTDDRLHRRTLTMNGSLRYLAEEWPEVHLIDWAEILAESSESPEMPMAGLLLAQDSVHTNPFGQAVLADAYVAALDRCDAA